jgi:hypothetical protein
MQQCEPFDKTGVQLMNAVDYRKQIDEFEQHYQYDSGNMRELLDTSPSGYQKFDNTMPLVSHRELLSADVYWVAKLAAMRTEDCGACLQLNVRMALEAGVDRDVVTSVTSNAENLAPELRDVFDFATYVTNNNLGEQSLIERIGLRFDKGQLLELGICVATAKLFPTIKRALGYTKACSLIEIVV